MSQLTPARRFALADARTNGDETHSDGTTTKLEHPVKLPTTTPSLSYRRFSVNRIEQIDSLPRCMSRRGRRKSLRVAISGDENQMMTTTSGAPESISIHWQVWITILNPADCFYATNQDLSP